MNKDFKILLLYPNEPMLGSAPINLALLAAYLKKEKYQVKLFDCTIYNQNLNETQDELRVKLGHVEKTDIKKYFILKKGNIYEEFIKTVEKYKPNLIGVTLVDGTIKFALSFLEKIKDKNIPVISGGVGTTFNYEKILNSGLIQYACIGEGEEALIELCSKLYNKEDCSRIKNIYTKDSVGNIIKNPIRPSLDLNTLPIPDFSIYENFRFFRSYRKDVIRLLGVDIDRGCPFNCTFCCSPSIKEIFKNNDIKKYYRIKSNDKFFKETKYLIKKYNINFLYILSETLLALPIDKFREFVKRYKTEINLPFFCQSRLDTFTEEKIKLLAEIGCKSIGIGLEHGSERIRNKILGKNLTNDQILKAFKILSGYPSITASINTMMGIPDETRKDIFETINLQRKISKILKGNFTINSYTFVPFSGTKLREVCINKGYIDENDEISFLYHDKSMLNMPSISKEEIYGLQKTSALYIRLPKKNWPDIKIAEQDIDMFNKLIKLIQK